jgi:hypothetical protein
VIGRIFRAIPFQKLALPAGASASVIRNALSDEEAAFAEEITNFRGGQFVGAPKADFPGIDGWIDNISASLKILSTKNLQGVVDKVEEGAKQAVRAGYSGGELFVKVPNFSSTDLTNAANSAYLTEINGFVNDGSFSAINFQFANGWLRIVGGTALSVGP